MADFIPLNQVCYVCTHISKKTHPVLLVVHDDEGNWQFMCGAAGHGPDDGCLVAVGNLIAEDPSLAECADLPCGFEAERSAVGQPWLRSQMTPAATAIERASEASQTHSAPPLREAAQASSPASHPAITMPRSEAFEDLVRTSQNYCMDCQDSLKEEYLLETWPRYDWSQVTRQLVFSDSGRPKVVADIQFVGSVSTESNTWFWAWANDSVAPELCEALLTVRKYGEAHGFPHLTTPIWRADEVDGWEMTSIAAFLLQARGVYRSPNKTGFTFMIMTAVGWAT